MTNRPDRKERKRRIKDQNAKASEPAPREPMNPEELERVVDGFMMIVFGILKVANIDPMTGLKEKGKDQFPSELGEKFPSEIGAQEVKNDSM